MKKEIHHYALGAFIDEIFKCAGFTRNEICRLLGIGHTNLNNIKKGLIAH